MGLESGNYVSDLVITNPPTTDSKQQGDDHLRLIKTVLRNTFPNATKAIYFPESSAKTANFAVAASDMNRIFTVDTTAGPVTMTLPTLTVADAGWQCQLLKTNAGVNPVLVTPPSGTILSGPLSLTSTRRSIPGTPCRIFWTGSLWVAERAVAVPVGSIIDFDGTALPAGYELPNGQTLAGSYPDYLAAKGSLVTRDITGRTTAMKEATATRLTVAGSGIDGSVLGAAGGGQGQVMVQANLPNVTLTTTIAAGQGSHQHSTQGFATVANIAGGAVSVYPQGSTTTGSQTLPQMSGTTPTGGSATPMPVVQPTIVLNKLLVVE